MGDGSCWVYILLLWHGMAPHAVTPVGRLRSTWRLGAKDDTTSSEALRVRMEDRVADLALREAMARWMTRNAWARRACRGAQSHGFVSSVVISQPLVGNRGTIRVANLVANGVVIRVAILVTNIDANRDVNLVAILLATRVFFIQ